MKKTSVDHDDTFNWANQLRDNKNFTQEEIQKKMYGKLTKLIYDNKRIDKDINENAKKMQTNKG